MGSRRFGPCWRTGAAAALVWLTWAGSAAAAGWAQLPGAASTDTSTEAAFAPLPDGTYEIAYRVRGTQSGKEAIAAAVLSPNGRISPAAPVTGDWVTLRNPALIEDNGDLRAYWGGIADLSWQSPVPGLETATAPGPRGPWSSVLGGVEVATCRSEFDSMCPSGGYLAELYSYAADVSATSTSAGPLAAWAGTLGVYVRAGTTPPRDTDAGYPGFPAGDDQENTADPGSVNQEGTDDPSHYPAPSFEPQCCGYEPRLALDYASGSPYLAWFSNASTQPGVLIQRVDPASGAPQASPYTVPGSQSNSGLRGRTPLTGVPGHAGVYTAIPSGRLEDTVLLARWSAGAPSRTYVVSTGVGRVRNTAVAADAAGHLWIVWTRATPAGITVSASRFDVGTGRFSAPTTVSAPPAAVDSFTLDAIALASGVEVIGSFGPDPLGGPGALWHTLLSLTPTVNVQPVTVAAGQQATVKIRVAIAGRPLAGATVTTIGAHSSAGRKHTPHARTNGNGVARLRLGPFHHSITVRLRVAKPGYATITVKLRVKVRRH